MERNQNNKKLYESIMKDVSKTVKTHLNESIDNTNELDIVKYIHSLPKTTTAEKIAKWLLSKVVLCLIRNGLWKRLHEYNLSIVLDLDMKWNPTRVDITSNVETAYSELLKFYSDADKDDRRVPGFITVTGINMDSIEIYNDCHNKSDYFSNTSDVRLNGHSPRKINYIISHIIFTVTGKFDSAIQSICEFINYYIQRVIPFIKDNNHIKGMIKYRETLI